MVDWNNPASKVSKYFTVKEMTYLPSWKVCHLPSEEEKVNLIKLANKMDQIREFLGRPINVHCAIRPILNCPGNPNHGKDYNAYIGGAPKSGHRLGSACDFDCGENCDSTRAKLLPKLAEFGIRVEALAASTWVHVDLMVPHPNRYFIP